MSWRLGRKLKVIVEWTIRALPWLLMTTKMPKSGEWLLNKRTNIGLAQMTKAQREFGAGLMAQPGITLTLKLVSPIMHMVEKIAVLSATGMFIQETNGTIYGARKNDHSFATTWRRWKCFQSPSSSSRETLTTKTSGITLTCQRMSAKNSEDTSLQSTTKKSEQKFII